MNKTQKVIVFVIIIAVCLVATAVIKEAKSGGMWVIGMILIAVYYSLFSKKKENEPKDKESTNDLTLKK